MIDTLRTQIDDASNDLERTVADIPQELFEKRPGPHQNPAGFIYFHVLRHWDRDLNLLCKDQPADGDAWHRGSFGDELDYHPLGLGANRLGSGFGYNDRQVDEVPKNRDVLMRYQQMLHDETLAYLDGTDEAALTETKSNEYAFENPYQPERWVRHAIAHTYMHIGDIQFVKGLIGMPDSTYPGASADSTPRSSA